MTVTIGPKLESTRNVMNRIIKWMSTGIIIVIGIIATQAALHSQDRPALHRRPVSKRASLRYGLGFAGSHFLISSATNGEILYSVGLDGEYLGTFAPTINIPGGNLENQFEHPLAVSTGLGGFPCRDYYVGAGMEIWHITNNGVAFDTFVRGLDGDIKTLVFDTHGKFGYDLLVGTLTGAIYRVNSAGAVTKLAFLGELIRDVAIVPPEQGLGPFDGQLFVSSGSKGQLRAISSSGIDTTLNAGSKLSYVEGIYVIPRDFGTSGRSESEGFYTYIWPGGLLKTEPHDFASLRGDALVSTINRVELLWRMHWNGSTFEFSTVAEYPDNVSAHELVTFDKISDGGKCLMTEDRMNAKRFDSSGLPHRLLTPEYYRAMTQNIWTQQTPNLIP